MKRAVLKLQGVSKSFGALRVAEAIGLEVLAGETHAIKR